MTGWGINTTNPESGSIMMELTQPYLWYYLKSFSYQTFFNNLVGIQFTLRWKGSIVGTAYLRNNNLEMNFTSASTIQGKLSLYFGYNPTNNVLNIFRQTFQLDGKNVIFENQNCKLSALPTATKNDVDNFFVKIQSLRMTLNSSNDDLFVETNAISRSKIKMTF